MKLVSVNVSMPKTVDHLGRKVSTGIYNESVTGRVLLIIIAMIALSAALEKTGASEFYARLTCKLIYFRIR